MNNGFDEKLITNDILGYTHMAINAYTYGILEANNKEFRDTLIQAKDNLEDLEWDLYCFAKQKKYYVPAAPAGKADVEQVKNAISGK